MNDLGMTGPIFRVPGPREFAKVEIWRIWTGFFFCRTATVSVLQTSTNSCLSRNGSRMHDIRNRDQEKDRAGPRSIFRPLPGPTNPNNLPKIVKKTCLGSLAGVIFAKNGPIEVSGGRGSIPLEKLVCMSTFLSEATRSQDMLKNTESCRCLNTRLPFGTYLIFFNDSGPNLGPMGPYGPTGPQNYSK